MTPLIPGVCPFCGSWPYLTRIGRSGRTPLRAVVCSCGASGPHRPSDHQAVMAWNQTAAGPVLAA